MTQKTDAQVKWDSPDEIDLLQYFFILVKYRKMILFIVLTAFAISIGYALFKGDIYTATASILPPRDSGGMSSAALIPQSIGLPSNLLNIQTPSDLYEGMLRSRSVADRIIDKFELKERYGKKNMEETYKELAMRTNFQVSSQIQIISISVDDEDPVISADLANAYLDALDEVNRKVNVGASHNKRVFLEKRLKSVNSSLNEAESNLRAFQEKYGILSISDQSRSAIEGASKIKAEIITSEAELSMLKRFGTNKQKDVAMLNSKIEELQKQLAKIESGDSSDDSLYIPFNEMPAIGMELAKLTRDVNVQEELFKLITNQYELAKIEEAKDVKTIQVLDRAIPPDKKSGPRKVLIIVISLFVSLTVAVVMALFMGYMDRIKNDEYERYQQVVKSFSFLKFHFKKQ